jgi:hypothetical protein
MWTCQQDACGFMSDLFQSPTRETDNGYFYSANNTFDGYVSQCDSEIEAFRKCRDGDSVQGMVGHFDYNLMLI